MNQVFIPFQPTHFFIPQWCHIFLFDLSPSQALFSVIQHCDLTKTLKVNAQMVLEKDKIHINLRFIFNN